MFILNERVQGVTDEMIKLYKKISPSTIGHMTELGLINCLRPYQKNFHFVGNAVTVQLPRVDATAMRKVVDVVKPGDVVCVNTSGEYDRAPLGEMVGLALKFKGVAGVIIDGAICDLQSIQNMGLKICCRGISAMTTRIIGSEGWINVPIAIDNVVIKPGDLVVADDDGIYVVDPKYAMQVGQEALDRQKKEPAVIKRIGAGESLAQINDLDKYFFPEAEKKEEAPKEAPAAK